MPSATVWLLRSDKDSYQSIFTALREATETAIEKAGLTDTCVAWSTRFFRDGGVQGQRPVDLWAAITNKPDRSFGRFPQIYVIASERGIELGFAVAIHEDDYYNVSIKARNREIIPALYRKLPSPNSQVIADISRSLDADGDWQFGLKNRQGATGNFSSLAELVAHLKSPESSIQGGGTVFRVVSPRSLDAGFDLDGAMARIARLYAPLMAILSPTTPEVLQMAVAETVRQAAEDIDPFDPTDVEDGRLRVLRSVALRQGQAKFREALLEAYDGRCAISGTRAIATLQAAHIYPYSGETTNKVQNGILLRADIHNLFDLGLIQIDPDRMVVTVADAIRDTAYGKLSGRPLRMPSKQSNYPSAKALRLRWTALGN